MIGCLHHLGIVTHRHRPYHRRQSVYIATSVLDGAPCLYPMPLQSKITPESILQSIVIESFDRAILPKGAQVTNVTKRLPRKRGAKRTRVKFVRCQSAPCNGNHTVRICRDLPFSSMGRISSVNAQHLNLTIKRITPGVIAPPALLA